MDLGTINMTMHKTVVVFCNRIFLY